GIVWNLPQRTERSLRFEFMVDRFCTAPAPAACGFQAEGADAPASTQFLSLRTPGKVLINLYQPLDVVPGQRWQFQLRLRQPRGFANPGGFDYEAWLMQKRIRATGYVRQHVDNALLQENTGER